MPEPNVDPAWAAAELKRRIRHHVDSGAITQRMLARQSGVSQPSISRWLDSGHELKLINLSKLHHAVVSLEMSL